MFGVDRRRRAALRRGAHPAAAAALVGRPVTSRAHVPGDTPPVHSRRAHSSPTAAARVAAARRAGRLGLFFMAETHDAIA